MVDRLAQPTGVGMHGLGTRGRGGAVSRVLKRADHDPNQDAIRGFRNATMVVDSPQCRSILKKSAATHGGETWPYELADSG
jgi:hypothetical protein